jgi:hypothetical protein
MTSTVPSTSSTLPFFAFFNISAPSGTSPSFEAVACIASSSSMFGVIRETLSSISARGGTERGEVTRASMTRVAFTEDVGSKKTVRSGAQFSLKISD